MNCRSRVRTHHAAPGYPSPKNELQEIGRTAQPSSPNRQLTNKSAKYKIAILCRGVSVWSVTQHFVATANCYKMSS